MGMFDVPIRGMTPGEVALAKKIFKDSLIYNWIMIHNGKYPLTFGLQEDNSGMSPNGEIFIHGNSYSDDYSKERAGIRALFIHELVHVWQYQNNVFLDLRFEAVLEYITEGFNYDKAYDYKLEYEKDLLGYDIEQQASIIEHYYLISVENIDIDYITSKDKRILNKERGVELFSLYKSILNNFIKDPGYAK